MRIAIDARKLDDFGIGTYVRHLVKYLPKIDPESEAARRAQRKRAKFDLLINHLISKWAVDQRILGVVSGEAASQSPRQRSASSGRSSPMQDGRCRGRRWRRSARSSGLSPLGWLPSR